MSLESLRVTSTAYIALDDRVRSWKSYRLDEAAGPTSKLGLTLQEWDGMLSPTLFPFLFYFLQYFQNSNANT